MTKTATEPTLDQQLEAANLALNEARATKVRKSTHISRR